MTWWGCSVPGLVPATFPGRARVIHTGYINAGRLAPYSAVRGRVPASVTIYLHKSL